MGIRVLKGGLLSTVQDLGRIGMQRFGVPVGGAMDSFAMQLANLCLSNPLHKAVLEMTLVGPTLEFAVQTVICICGADMNPVLNGRPIGNGKPLHVQKGDILKFGSVTKGCRTYLAVKGGFQVEPILNSMSTYLKAGIGKKLEKEDLLPIKESTSSYQYDWQLSDSLFSYMNRETIRFIEGRQSTWFREHYFDSSSYQIETHSDRMGYRLKGEPILLKEKRELITEGTAFGTIQIPPNGQPIILMAERQPTGGYPKIGEVITADLPILAQRKPGDSIRFEKVGISEAQEEMLERQRTIRMLQSMVRERGNK